MHCCGCKSARNDVECDEEEVSVHVSWMLAKGEVEGRDPTEVFDSVRGVCIASR